MAKYVAVIDGMTSSTAGDLTSLSSNLITQEGVVVASGTDLQVTQADTPALSVEVQPGSCYILRDAYVASDNTIRYWHAVLTAAEEVVITSNSSGQVRVDRICAKINTSVTVDASASNVFELVAVAGTPGAGAPATPDNHLSLATVSVDDGETQILTADITDTRVFIGLGLPYGSEGYRFYDTAGAKAARVYQDSDGIMYLNDGKSSTAVRFNPSTNDVEVKIPSAGGAYQGLINRYDTIYLTPGFLKPATTSPCATSTTNEAGTNDVDYDTLDFDATSSERAFANVQMPDSYDGGTIQFRIVWLATGGTIGTFVAMDLKGRAFGNNQAIDQADGTLQQVQDTLEATSRVFVSAWSAAITLAGVPKGGDYVHFVLSRDIGDNLSVDAKIMGVQIRWRRKQYSDA